jgi:hypothetical protein
LTKFFDASAMAATTGSGMIEPPYRVNIHPPALMNGRTPIWS